MDHETADSLPAQIAAALAEQIIRGILKPGDRVRQDAVARDFNASHVPVREAFRQLEARGLLVPRARKGVYVALLDQASIVEITRMRTALEVLALKYAIPQLGEEDIALAQRAIGEGNHCRDMGAWEAANRRFHASLYRPCGMPRVLEAIDTLHEARLRYMYATATLIDWNPASQDEHETLIGAIEARDVRLACALLEEHINEAGEILIDAVRRLPA